MLGILGDQEASDPTPGLDRVDELLEQLRSAGLEVELVVEGEPRVLDPGLAVDALVRWYSAEHLHSAIRFVNPEDRHGGRDFAILAGRRKLCSRARAKMQRGGRGARTPAAPSSRNGSFWTSNGLPT